MLNRCRRYPLYINMEREKNMSPRLLALTAALGCLLAGGFSLAAAQTVDVAGAEALAKKSKCSNCHSLDKKKSGPTYKETAAKYKGKPGGESTLFTHLTTSPKVMVDGKEEVHESPKTKNEAEIKNLVGWILSR